MGHRTRKRQVKKNYKFTRVRAVPKAFQEPKINTQETLESQWPDKITE